MTDTIDALDAEVGALQEQAAAVAAAPQSFDEVWPAAEQALDEAADAFLRLGPQLARLAPMLPEQGVAASSSGNRRGRFDEPEGADRGRAGAREGSNRRRHQRHRQAAAGRRTGARHPAPFRKT